MRKGKSKKRVNDEEVNGKGVPQHHAGRVINDTIAYDKSLLITVLHSNIYLALKFE